MSNNYKIRLCLQTYNRPQYAKIALDSLINQLNNKYEIYISDNSTNSDFHNIFIKKYSNLPNIKYVFRQSNLTAIQHFNKLIEESSNFDFVMFFHDDDILFPNYIDYILNTKFLSDPNVAAIGVNAFKMLGNARTKKPIIYTKSNITINSKLKLVNQYFNLEYNGAAPFPGYLYRVKSILSVNLQKEDGGKYSDLSFLIKLLEFGNIEWLSEPLMFYRLHNNNDSKFIVNEDREALWKYLIKYKLLAKNTASDYEMTIKFEKFKFNQIKTYIFYSYVIKFLIFNIINLILHKIIFELIKKQVLEL